MSAAFLMKPFAPRIVNIDNLAPEIEALTKEFEKLFPEEAKEKKLYFPL